MKELSRRQKLMAELIKEAGAIESEVKLAKMLCYIEKERGIETGFPFKDSRYGNYTLEVKNEAKALEDAGMIKCRVEEGKGIWGDNIKKHFFVASDKLKGFDTGLTKKEKTAVMSVYREFKAYSAAQIKDYDHAIYRHGKTRTDVEAKKASLKETRSRIQKHGGDEEAAFREWLSEA